jgi:hypothetical protein
MTILGLPFIMLSVILLLGPYIYKIHAMADGSRSSSTGPESVTSAWVRWAMPSAADLIFLAVLGVLVLTPLSVKLLNDAGIGWHIRTGQLIVTTLAVPRVDPFSSQTPKPWIAWEWLYDLIVGQLDASAGLNGVVWLTAVVIAATFAAVFRCLVRRGTDLGIALVLTLLAISASMIHFLARPHVLSWLFALVWFWILDSMESSTLKSKRWLWALPVTMLVWANVHGGFLLGFVLVAVYWLGAVWSWFRLKESRIEEALEKIAARMRVRDLTVVGLASALASLVNPYGWHLHEHIYRYLSSRFLMDHIEEFQSPNFHGIAQRCFLLLLLIVIAVLVVRASRFRLSQVLLVLFAVYAALYASRNILVSSILLVSIIGPHFPSLGWARFTQRMGVVDARLRGHLWPVGAGVVVLVIALNGGRAGSRQLMDAHFDPQRMPVQAVNFLERSGGRGPVLSPDYWGGYLIYRLYPYRHVGIDDRHDFYGEDFLRWYMTATHVEPGWESFVNWRDCAVLPRKAALTAVLSKEPGWKIVYSDDVATVFQHAEREDSDHSPGD